MGHIFLVLCLWDLFDQTWYLVNFNLFGAIYFFIPENSLKYIFLDGIIMWKSLILLSLAVFLLPVIWFWCSVHSSANYSPELRQDLSTKCTVSCEVFRLAVGAGTLLGPVWVLGTITSDSFTWFLPEQHVVFSYTFTDRFSAEYLRGASYQPWKLSLLWFRGCDYTGKWNLKDGYTFCGWKGDFRVSKQENA